MPNGRTHDAITLLTAAPVFAATYLYTKGLAPASVVAAAYLFGGLMFGPDLDTISRQYSRWSIFRAIWFPYRSFFKHRSRFSHGLIFGSLIRVVYFVGVCSLIAIIASWIYASLSGGRPVGVSEFVGVCQSIGEKVRSQIGDSTLLLSFFGLWLGAASHTLTDIAGSFIKTGRVAKFL